MNDMQGLWSHPQLLSRNRWSTIDSPVGEVPALLPPGVNNQYAYRMAAIPAVGEHTEAILKELGLKAEDIQALHDAKGI
jgi:crotonobetainyl-CoA:carnitine CoA-transferase CaiB-like acyl-CoA transferase